jgi:hypothetical protein
MSLGLSFSPCAARALAKVPGASKEQNVSEQMHGAGSTNTMH